MAANQLSKEQVEELRQAFDLFDKDKGGSISTRELGFTMRAMGMNPTEAEILDLLCEFDSDNNGTIEFEEFCSMMSGRMLVVHDLDTVRMAFRALDQSGSGFIRYKHLKHLITNIGDKLTDKEAEYLLGEINLKKDGLIQYQEFIKMLTGD